MELVYHVSRSARKRLPPRIKIYQALNSDVLGEYIWSEDFELYKFDSFGLSVHSGCCTAKFVKVTGRERAEELEKEKIEKEKKETTQNLTYIDRNIFIRSRISGCVAYKESRALLFGSVKNKWETASLTFILPVFIFIIFSSAEAKPSG